jgi:hypothetical protein
VVAAIALATLLAFVAVGFGARSLLSPYKQDGTTFGNDHDASFRQVLR